MTPIARFLVSLYNFLTRSPPRPRPHHPQSPSSKQLYLWFCGLISTRRTEVILNCAPHGSFLVRLHRRRPGYILSLKCHNEVLHYRIRVSSEHFYYIVASNGSGLHHPSLRELVRYHLREPVPVRLAICTVLTWLRLKHFPALFSPPRLRRGAG